MSDPSIYMKTVQEGDVITTTLFKGKVIIDGEEWKISPESPLVLRVMLKPREFRPDEHTIIAGLEDPPDYEIEFNTRGASHAE